ncbi:MAG: hypothetical protein ACOCVI_03330 [Planctomycetota bacterium]
MAADVPGAVDGLHNEITRGLVIRPPAVEQILRGTKRWEIRGRPVRIRGPVALIEVGSPRIRGVCEIVDCLGPLSERAMERNAHLHRAPERYWRGGDAYARVFAWVLGRPRRLRRPWRYIHPRGAVTWVNLRSRLIRGK